MRERAAEDPFRIGPARLVLDLAAPFEDWCEAAAGLHAVFDQVPAEDRVARRGSFDVAGSCGGEECVSGVEPAGDGVLGGAPEMVGARDP